MQVLRYGNNIQNETKEKQCHKCASVLSYTNGDIKTFYSSWRRTGVESSECDVKEYIICPVCGSDITLKSWVLEY